MLSEPPSKLGIVFQVYSVKLWNKFFRNPVFTRLFMLSSTPLPTKVFEYLAYGRIFCPIFFGLPFMFVVGLKPQGVDPASIVKEFREQ